MKHLDRLQLAQQEFEAYQRELPQAAAALQSLLTETRVYWEKFAQPVVGVGRTVWLKENLHILVADPGLCLVEIDIRGTYAAYVMQPARKLTALEAVERYSLRRLMELFNLTAERLADHYRTRREANAQTCKMLSL